jgi:16S rRNA (cytosine1402-N4)-methyltransferase
VTREHVPVLLEETVAGLLGAQDPRSSLVFVDATFGRGGHSRRLLGLLGPSARVIGIDRDPEAEAVGAALAGEDRRFCMHAGQLSNLAALLDELGVGQVQGVMMDLGVSSPQVDDPLRGFSFQNDGPLDMRMDPRRGVSAARWIDEAGEADIARVLFDLGEERFARRIAAAIVAARPLRTTGELAAVVRQAQPRATPGKHPATRTFQALRMVVNDELGELDAGLAQAFARLAPGGRLAVISFHSLEDRRVKQFFRACSSPPSLPRRLPVRSAVTAVAARVVESGCTASPEELARNPRARSARLRVLEKLA